MKPSIPIADVPLEDLARRTNFIMKYFDRRTPTIDIRQIKPTDPPEDVLPHRFCEGAFPESIAVPQIDEFVLQLIETADETINPRFAFIYLYQVIEYTGFYFIDDKVRRTLRRHLKDPAMINCPDHKLQEIFALFTELTHNDDVRMRKVIEECCDPAVLWQEIENDKEFFSTARTCDGGFEIPALISTDMTLSAWSSMWMPKLYDQITKIRNCLVHAREKRQSSVILPTENNDQIIERYLPLMRRLAEQLALKSE